MPPLTGKLRPKPENIGPMALRSKEPAPEERGDVKFLHVGLLIYKRGRTFAWESLAGSRTFPKHITAQRDVGLL